MQSVLQVQLTADELKSMLTDVIRSTIAQFSTTSKTDQYLTREEVAELLGITLPTVHSYSLSGKLKAYRIGKSVRFKRSEVEAALKPFRIV